MDPDGLRLCVFLGGLALFLVMETLRPRRDWMVSRGRRLLFHGSLAAGNSALLRVVAHAPLLGVAGWVRAEGWGLLPWLGMRGGAELVLAWVLLDLLDYWWHRANHRVGLLWRFHKVHHADTHLDATTALRFHPGELLVSAVVKASWILLLGPSALAFALFEASVSLASQFHHSNLDLPGRLEGGLERVLVTPRFHSSHHTVTPRTREANFSTILVAWDHLFGTYRDPEGEDLETLGLPGGRDVDLRLLPVLGGPLRDDY